MDSKELKFVLKLLGAPNYRAPIAAIKPNLRTKASERDGICRTLCDRGLVDCDERATCFRVTPAGKALLQLDMKRLPVSEDEVELIRAAAAGRVEVKDVALPSSRLYAALDRAIGRGFLKAEKTTIETVWLTQHGIDYLREEFTPSGSVLELSLDHLADYLRFLRKSHVQALSEDSDEVMPFEDGERSTADRPSVVPDPSLSESAPATPETVDSQSTAPPSADEVYEAIAQLDREHNTGNYLPLYFLRDRFAAALDRSALDRALYALQRQDRIELSSLQEAAHYTAEQVAAGIPQDIGGPLFFAIRT